MKECVAVVPVIVMALAAILFAMIAGFGCVIYAPDNRGS